MFSYADVARYGRGLKYAAAAALVLAGGCARGRAPAQSWGNIDNGYYALETNVITTGEDKDGDGFGDVQMTITPVTKDGGEGKPLKPVIFGRMPENLDMEKVTGNGMDIIYTRTEGGKSSAYIMPYQKGGTFGGPVFLASFESDPCEFTAADIMGDGFPLDIFFCADNGTDVNGNGYNEHDMLFVRNSGGAFGRPETIRTVDGHPLIVLREPKGGPGDEIMYGIAGRPDYPITRLPNLGNGKFGPPQADWGTPLDRLKERMRERQPVIEKPDNRASEI